jgi:3-oxoadipate enol-lactonase
MRLDARSVAQAIVEEVWNSDDHWRVRRLLTESCVFDDAGRSVRPAPLRLVDLVNTYKAFIPDLTMRICRQTAEGSRVTTDWEASGRHVGRVSGLPSTGRRIFVRGRLLTDDRHGGRLVRGTWDGAGLLKQVGAHRLARNRVRLPPARQLALRARYDVGGVPLLLFPTMSLPGWLTWKRVSDAFLTKAPVITFQLSANRRAFERVPVAGYRLSRENRCLRHTLEHHGTTPPYDIVGHSIGGLLALDFALNYPELTRSLTLIEPGLRWLLAATGPLNEDIASGLTWRRSCYGPISPARYARFLQATYREEGYDPRHSPRWPLMRAYRANMAYRLSVLRHHDQPDRLRRLHCPVLLVQGRASDSFHHAVMHVLRTLVPHATFLELPGGHVPHYGAGATPFIGALTAFVSSHARPAAHTA